MMNKTAYDQGIMDAYAALGIEKTAIWSLIGRGVARAGAGIFNTLGRGGSAMMRGGATQGGALGKGLWHAGRGVKNTGMHIARAGEAFAANPMRTLGQGAMNVGKGALMFGGKGVGGALGKGVGAYGMGSAMFGGGGGAQAPQQMMPQPQYNQMYGGY